MSSQHSLLDRCEIIYKLLLFIKAQCKIEMQTKNECTVQRSKQMLLEALHVHTFRFNNDYYYYSFPLSHWQQTLWSQGRIDYWCNNKNYDDNNAFHNKYESNQLSLWNQFSIHFFNFFWWQAATLLIQQNRIFFSQRKSDCTRMWKEKGGCTCKFHFWYH